MDKNHHEVNFEDYITKELVSNGWLEGKPSEYDKQRALYPDDVIAWIKGSCRNNYQNRRPPSLQA